MIVSFSDGLGKQSSEVASTDHLCTVVPDKGDRVDLELGINNVSIRHIDGSWTISVPNHNIKVVTREDGDN